MDFIKEINGNDYYFHHSYNSRPNSNFFNLHSHNAFELYLFLGGQGKINIEGRFYPLEPWDLFFIYPGQFHRVLLENDIPYERKVIRFDYSFIRSIDPGDILINSFSDFNTIKGTSLIKTRIPQIYERIKELFNLSEPIQKITLTGVVIDLLFNLSKNKDLGCMNNESDCSDKISDVISYINENLEKDLSLDMISKRFFISKFYLSRLFKESTGSTLGHFILMKRLHFAKRMIYGGATPINACFLSGFTDYSSFYKSYKKYLGVSPSNTIKP